MGAIAVALASKVRANAAWTAKADFAWSYNTGRSVGSDKWRGSTSKRLSAGALGQKVSSRPSPGASGGVGARWSRQASHDGYSSDSAHRPSCAFTPGVRRYLQSRRHGRSAAGCRRTIAARDHHHALGARDWRGCSVGWPSRTPASTGSDHPPRHIPISPARVADPRRPSSRCSTRPYKTSSCTADIFDGRIRWCRPVTLVPYARGGGQGAARC